MIVTREEGARPIKAWLGTKEIHHEEDVVRVVIDVEDAALQQTKNIARLPFIAPQGVALMPDAHLGEGAYKRLDVVMELQKDLVEVVHVLKAVLCVKGN